MGAAFPVTDSMPATLAHSGESSSSPEGCLFNIIQVIEPRRRNAPAYCAPFGTLPCIGATVVLHVARSTNRTVRQLIWLAFLAEIDRASEPAMNSLGEESSVQLSENVAGEFPRQCKGQYSVSCLASCTMHRKVKSPGDTPGVEIKTLAPIPEFRKPSGFPRMPCRDFPRGHIPRPDFH
jgi:hypothetical protein